MKRKYTISIRRHPIIKGGYAIIPLTDGNEALVDIEDAEFVGQWNWHTIKSVNGLLYAARKANIDGSRRALRMHRELLNPPERMVVHHIDGNGLNNRRSNLRLITQRENAMLNVRGRRGLE